MEKQNKCDCVSIHQDKVDLAKKELHKTNNLKNLSGFFKVFSDETRLKIICLLDKLGSMCVCDMAVVLNMTKSAISHQLSNLKENKIVASSKVGKIVFYSLSDSHVKDIYELGSYHIGENK